MAKSTDNPVSRYLQGGTTEVFEKRLGWWERRTITERDDDIVYIIPKEYEHRPDRVSNHFYGTPDLMWLVLQYNKILDVTTEFVVGKEIKLPNRSRVSLTILTR